MTGNSISPNNGRKREDPPPSTCQIRTSVPIHHTLTNDSTTTCNSPEIAILPARASLKSKALEYVSANLAGLGQVIFSNKPIVGTVFMLGIILNSPLLGVGAVAGLMVGTLAAYSFGYDRNRIKEGLYGFNAALVGIASYAFFAPSIYSTALLVAGSIGSTLLMEKMSRFSLPPRTAPFVMTTWAIMTLGTVAGLTTASASNGLIGNYANIIPDTFGVLRGMGQIMFQNASLTGLLFLSGVFLTSPKQGVYALGGSVVGALVSPMLGASPDAINAGLWGYNAALSATAFSEAKKSAIAVGASLTIDTIFRLSGIPALTAPFVLATWVTAILLNKIDKKN